MCVQNVWARLWGRLGTPQGAHGCRYAAQDVPGHSRGAPSAVGPLRGHPAAPSSAAVSGTDQGPDQVFVTRRPGKCTKPPKKYTEKS